MLLPIKIFLVAGFLVDGQSTPTKSYRKLRFGSRGEFIDF